MSFQKIEGGGEGKAPLAPRFRHLCLGDMHFLILDTLLDLKYKQDSFQGIKSVFEDSGKWNSANK